MSNCGNCTHRQIGICKNTDSDRYDKTTPSEFYCDGFVEVHEQNCMDCKWVEKRSACMLCGNKNSGNFGNRVSELSLGCKEWEKGERK